MEWVISTLFWYVHMLVVGLIFLPLTKKLFSRFFDHGYAFSKTLGILFLSYATFILGILKIAPFTQLSLYILLVIFGVVNLVIFLKEPKRGAPSSSPLSRKLVFVVEEVLFLGALLLLAYIRGQEPSIHGLEKFMDFGFINSVLKSTHFPPLDMWYSAGPDVNGVDSPLGFPVNYYYFGHLTGAVLVKLTGIPSYIGYNLILATIFAQGVTLAFSLIFNIVQLVQNAISKSYQNFSLTSYIYGLLGSFILNLGGNLHTIYLFTKSYPNESPEAFWRIFDTFNPTKYWYPNATRFIPFTIHEFPSYSYVVADLHGHVFDIPFVLLTLALLFHFFYSYFVPISQEKPAKTSPPKKLEHSEGFLEFLKKTVISWQAAFTVFIGFLCAVHYMTNAFDGPIYMLLALAVLFLIHRLSYTFIIHFVLLCISYLIFSYPFTAHFSLFISGIGVNCPPAFLFGNGAESETVVKYGPFLFEKANCQKSEIWMMFILWGFFWINFLTLLIIKAKERFFRPEKTLSPVFSPLQVLDIFMILVFCLGTFLIIVPEFFYVKDIYPAHFRANTMFKLGYQAFMMMSIATTYVLFRIKLLTPDRSLATKILALLVFSVYLIIFQSTPESLPEATPPTFPLEYLLWFPLILLVFLAIFFRKEKNAILSFILTYITTNLVVLVCIYPFFSFPSYYGNLQKSSQERKQDNIQTSLDGQAWLLNTAPEDLEIITYINETIPGQPVILEGQGDSYTDYERISSYTGNPTVAGWWVHEWLWRGSSDIVGKRIPDISTIYESSSIAETTRLLNKYHVEYVVISNLERSKYPSINEEKFDQIGRKIFSSSNGFGALYQLK